MVVPSLASLFLRAAFLLLLLPGFPAASAEDLPTSSVEQQAGHIEDEATAAVNDLAQEMPPHSDCPLVNPIVPPTPRPECL